MFAHSFQLKCSPGPPNDDTSLGFLAQISITRPGKNGLARFCNFLEKDRSSLIEPFCSRGSADPAAVFLIETVAMKRSTRDFFDRHLEEVMAAMPPRVHELLQDVTLYVEDHPSTRIMSQLGIRHRDDLCGLYTGVPLTRRHVEISGVLSDAVYIYRQGILRMAMNERGEIDEDQLRREIRITVLHELGHHHGLDEGDLQELGY
jgi:predicted Zn-dependent protease with MMP-like domain